MEKNPVDKIGACDRPGTSYAPWSPCWLLDVPQRSVSSSSSVAGPEDAVQVAPRVPHPPTPQSLI
jgi:hypothetical protein